MGYVGIFTGQVTGGGKVIEVVLDITQSLLDSASEIHGVGEFFGIISKGFVFAILLDSSMTCSSLFVWTQRIPTEQSSAPFWFNIAHFSSYQRVSCTVSGDVKLISWRLNNYPRAVVISSLLMLALEWMAKELIDAA